MALVYMYRHQHAGIVTSHAFAGPPSAEQLAPIIAECERLHGKEGWGMIHEAELLTSEVPSFPDRTPAPSVSEAMVSAVGTVGPAPSDDVEATEEVAPGMFSRLKSAIGLG